MDALPKMTMMLAYHVLQANTKLLKVNAVILVILTNFQIAQIFVLVRAWKNF